MTRRPPPSLLAITPGDAAAGARPADRLVAAVRAAVAAGLRGLLVREAALGDRALLELARRLRDALGPEGWLALHDRPHLAAAAGADAVHLGFRSLPPAAARLVVGPRVAVGLSVHAHDVGATPDDADYVVFGPVRATPSKAGRLRPTGFDGLECAVRAAGRPLVAVGGLEPADVGPARAAGAAGVAVLRGILGSPDPAAAVRGYLGAEDAPRP